MPARIHEVPRIREQPQPPQSREITPPKAAVINRGFSQIQPGMSRLGIQEQDHQIGVPPETKPRQK